MVFCRSGSARHGGHSPPYGESLNGHELCSISRELLVMAGWAPNVDITETDAAYLIKGELPGVNKEDIKDGMLNVIPPRQRVGHNTGAAIIRRLS